MYWSTQSPLAPVHSRENWYIISPIAKNPANGTEASPDLRTLVTIIHTSSVKKLANEINTR